MSKPCDMKTAVADQFDPWTVRALVKEVPTDQSVDKVALKLVGPASVRLVLGALGKSGSVGFGICPLSLLPNNNMNNVVLVPIFPGATSGHVVCVQKDWWDKLPPDTVPFGNNHRRREWGSESGFKLQESQHPSLEGSADAHGAFQTFERLFEKENEKAQKKAEKAAAKKAAEAAAAADKARMKRNEQENEALKQQIEMMRYHMEQQAQELQRAKEPNMCKRQCTDQPASPSYNE